MENECRITEYSACRLCARGCGVNRSEGRLGVCGVPEDIYVARAALHRWEEPPISGTGGSGTIFFSGCSLGCVFCQNREISRAAVGKRISLGRLTEIMLELEAEGAHNINFVTPTHYAPSVVRATAAARAAGLSVPTVYNTASYETEETVKMLDGTVDIYLADYKYDSAKTAALSRAPDYPEVARAAIREMVEQRGSAIIEGGLMRSGVIVRLLLLPGHLAEAKLSVKYLYGEYGDDIFISLMNQYTPMAGVPASIARTVTHVEYDSLVDYALKKGVRNAFVQEGGTARESFIPPFDLTGI